MARLILWLRSSIERQFFIVFGTIAFLTLLVALPAMMLTELSTGSGGAINVSGSMRMQSYKLALAVADPFLSTEERHKRTFEAADEFGAKLVSRGLLNGMTESEADPVYRQYKLLKERFESEVRPLAEASSENVDARRAFVLLIPSFVDEVDRFVQALENGLNTRLALLKWLLAIILLGSLCVTYVMLGVIRKRIFKPLTEIGSAANAVRQGDFSVRAAADSPDEIGRLSGAFNFMVDELGRLYGNLEKEVERKTLDLNRRNATLELISRVGQAVQFDERFDAAGLGRLLDEAGRLLGAAGCAVYAGEGESCYELAKSADWEDSALPDVARFSLSENNPGVGIFAADFGGCTPEAWQRGTASAIAQAVGRSIERVTRQLDDRRLAVLEERSTIARELHDSIAQSLSFSRIQAHRLKVFVERGESRETIVETVKELDEGVSTAYRQLREVLTAFRLQISSAGLNGAVAETADEFRNRTGVAVTVENGLVGVELSPNSQVHLIHILREALVNVEKHARASAVSVRLARAADGSVAMTIEDNGIGIPEAASKYRHFGLSIMRERAEALGGTLQLTRISEAGGTRVQLTIPAADARISAGD